VPLNPCKVLLIGVAPRIATDCGWASNCPTVPSVGSAVVSFSIQGLCYLPPPRTCVVLSCRRCVRSLLVLARVLRTCCARPLRVISGEVDFRVSGVFLPGFIFASRVCPADRLLSGASLHFPFLQAVQDFCVPAFIFFYFRSFTSSLW
jgi:hypothetical protein